MFHVHKNQVVDLHKQKLKTQSEVLSKDACPFLKVFLSSGLFLTFLL